MMREKIVKALDLLEDKVLGGLLEEIERLEKRDDEALAYLEEARDRVNDAIEELEKAIKKAKDVC